MTDLELIYLILAFFYVAECGYWIRPGSLVFVSQLGDGCRLLAAHTGAWLRNDHGGFVLGNFLPLGHSLLTAGWPVTLAPEGVVSGSCQVLTPDGRSDDAGRFLLWEDVHEVIVDGRQVRIDGQPFVRAATPQLAGRLATLLTELAALPAPERTAAIDKAVAGWLDATPFDNAFRRFRRISALLALPCTALFLYVFLVTPILFARFVFQDFLSPLPYYLALLGLVLVTYHLSHALLGGRPGERWSATMTMLVSPADAMHARDKLCHRLAVGHHPLAVASVVCAPVAFYELARQVLLDLRWPLPADGVVDARVVAAEQWFRDRLLAATEAFLRKAGIEPEDLLPDPVAERPECRSFCPRCLGQYLLEAGRCGQCALTLRSFAELPPRPAKPVPLPPPPPTAPPRPIAKPVVKGPRLSSRKRKRGKKR